MRNLRFREIQDLSLGYPVHKWSSQDLNTGSPVSEPGPVIVSFLVKCIRCPRIQGIYSKRNRHISKQLQLNVSANNREEGIRKDIEVTLLKTNLESKSLLYDKSRTTFLAREQPHGRHFGLVVQGHTGNTCRIQNYSNNDFCLWLGMDFIYRKTLVKS